ncbi:putative bifunctional diguanylate cyclase/phosphodiesterase [Spiribacter halobius]|uniref:GGDEF-domain containing protein n=1 Tax=Sediminicurvatus halobius TaxID=2182432 RepID=A0A2U2N038_9GAMM|nr:EAL domain-containing protein [Spiribacter halobius]PWG62432.1 hypothetical protein DEM34_12485 [Spiribacter halobius]UEX79535.1 EAL domain-containing protein [Spiribacter halobius]
MDPLQRYRALPIVVAEAAGDEPGLAPMLARAGFRDVRTAASAAAVEAALREAWLSGRQDEQIALVVISSGLLGRLDGERAQRLGAMAEEADAALVLLGGDDPGGLDGMAEAWAAGVREILPSSLPAEDTLSRLAAVLAHQDEVRRLRRRERSLEGEVAELRVAENRLQHMVYHDELTGLWNRRRLKQAVEVAILRAATLHRECALILLDMDRFKFLNDLEGHEAGDRMLVEVGRLLRRHARPGDTVARVGSDEFVLLMENTAGDEALGRAEGIREALEANRFRYGERYYRTCASLGVVDLRPDAHHLQTGELLARADQACFVAKERGRNQVHRYQESDPGLEPLRRDHLWAPRIRDALEQDRLFFCYQPIVRMLDGTVSHYECLVRMRDSEGRVHLPGQFIPVAERTGLIQQIDMWAVDQALDLLASLPAEQSQVSISVNLSAHAFRTRELFDLIVRRLEMAWVSPTRLVFEITETAAIENMERSRELVARLRALGCRFALDDFGSGFSTFNYIKHFPVDYLKLDGSFIVNINRDRTDQELVRHMIAIARSLGKQTIAEFVESREIHDTLRELGVDYVQGHYLGVAAETMEAPTPHAAVRQGAMSSLFRAPAPLPRTFDSDEGH